MNQQIENLFTDASRLVTALKLRVANRKTKAEKRLRPTYGDNWEMIYLEELRKEANLAQIQLQMCNMSSYEVAEWIYNLENNSK